MQRRFFAFEAMVRGLGPRRPEVDGAPPTAALSVTVGPDGRPLHDPPLEARDEAVFLLTAAAEIEHALMVQYLYAAYSVRVRDDQPNVGEIQELQDLVSQIAREEMGHLATVQNLLHVVGGPLNFNREHSPYASEIYPFRFKLEPISLDSLSKYVVAEQPLPPPADFPELDLLRQIAIDAQRANDGRPVGHVGPIFARLEQLFTDGLKDEDLRLDTTARQAQFEDWGFEARRPKLGERLIIDTLSGPDVAQVRSQAVAAIRKIAQQGEGFDLPPASSTQSESHFERFLHVYRRFKELSSNGTISLTWPVAENPNTSSPRDETPPLAHMIESITEANESKGRLTNPRARRWAHLFNLRYRLLLTFFSHFLRLDQELYIESPPQQGDRTARGLLLMWTFGEMRRLKKIATKLVQMPRGEASDPVNAGPPFELPYTLNLPDRETDRWRSHLDVSRAVARLIRVQLQAPQSPDAADEFLADMRRADEQAQAIMQSLAAGGGVPAGSLPTDFQKVVAILEEAVRGFDIGAHKNQLWDRIDRTHFIEGPHPLPVSQLISRKPDNSFDPDGSPLIERLDAAAPPRRMPRFRPKVPDSRIRFIRQWIADGCPDNTPPGELGIERERQPAPEATPAASIPPTPVSPLGFAFDIKPLFRDSDRNTMLAVSGFDLHDHADVTEWADRILAALDEGSMPCDGSWPSARVEIFRRWIADGKRP